MFTIPTLEYITEGDFIKTTNTIHPYYLRTHGNVYVTYVDFKYPEQPKTPKEFKTIDEAKHWIETIHYPSQIKKFLKEL